jgi:hypothetical protein
MFKFIVQQEQGCQGTDLFVKVGGGFFFWIALMGREPT